MTTSGDMIHITREIEARLPRLVGEKRRVHIRGVVETARELARRFNLDPHRIELAAVAHDMDRERSPGELMGYAADWGVPLTELERRVPKIAHGPITAERLRLEFALQDRDLLDAIRNHTLGHPGFVDQREPLGLVLFVADFCEPGRTKPDSTTRADVLAQRNLYRMAARIVERSRELFGVLEDPTERLYARLRE